MSFADLVAGFNSDLMEEANKIHSVRTGTYTGQVVDVKEQANRFDGAPELNLRIQLLDADLNKVGVTFATVTPVEKRTRSGKMAQATKLFYQFAKAMSANGAEEVVEQLSGFTFSCYGSEYFNAPNGEFPAELKDATKEDAEWKKLYLNADADVARDLCHEAGMSDLPPARPAAWQLS